MKRPRRRMTTPSDKEVEELRRQVESLRPKPEEEPVSGRYRVEPTNKPTGKHEWKVTDDKTGNTVYPGSSLGKAHTMADRLNKERPSKDE
jgi:hypothetical protein